MRVLVTGAAGFIGFHVARALIARGDTVTGFDNVNDYYDVGLKEARLAELARTGGDWRFLRVDLADRAAVDAAFAAPFDRVIHLAAQAGVRHSLEQPLAYVSSNLVGFAHVLEACRHARTPHLTFASTSSVYGADTAMPFSEPQGVGHPLQLYAATKRANELMAHAYAHLYRLPCTGLRFFTVYGPWGRPDMAPMLFAKAISEGPDPALQPRQPQPRLHLRRRHRRRGHPRLRPHRRPRPGLGCRPTPTRPAPAPPSASTTSATTPPWRSPTSSRRSSASSAAPRSASSLPLQPGDVPDTWADSSRLARDTGWRPTTPVAEGVRRFVAWFRDFYAA